MQVKKQQLELDMEQWTGSKLGKEYVKAIYCHLTYTQSTSCEMLGWIKHKLESSWIIEKARDLQKNIYFCFMDYAKAFDCVHHNKLWKILKEMGIPVHLTCLLRNNLYAGQEATVRTGHGTTYRF